MLRVDYARWGQTPEDLRHLALSAPHARTRERALARFDITQHSCATQVAVRTGRRAHTVIGWVHAYNAQGPDALAFRRTGGRRPFFARTPKPTAARSSAPPSAQPRRRPEPGPIQRRAGHCAAWRLGARPVRASGLPRDDPRGPAPPQAVVEESQEASRPSRPGAAAGVDRAAPGLAGRRPTRPAPLGLRGRGAHPPGRGPRLWLGRMAGANAANASLSPPARRASPPRCRSTGSTSPTRVRCGCGLTRAPTAAPPWMCYGAC